LLVSCRLGERRDSRAGRGVGDPPPSRAPPYGAADGRPAASSRARSGSPTRGRRHGLRAIRDPSEAARRPRTCRAAGPQRARCSSRSPFPTCLETMRSKRGLGHDPSPRQQPTMAWLSHGAYRDRTGDLRLAKEARYVSRRYVMRRDRTNARFGLTEGHCTRPNALTSELTRSSPVLATHYPETRPHRPCTSRGGGGVPRPGRLGSTRRTTTSSGDSTRRWTGHSRAMRRLT
jgi:hypothetical protein